MAGPAGAQAVGQQASLTEQIARLLAKPVNPDGIQLDTAFFTSEPVGGELTRTAGVRRGSLLPTGHVWKPAGEERQRIPLQLCEFLAYKSALAYELDETRIKNYLEQCCDGISSETSCFRFFDSARTGASEAGKLADAQGYGFVHDGTAYVIFRGTQPGKNDWLINRTDTMTNLLGGEDDKRRQNLRKLYGPLLDKLGDLSPGRHVGFSIAWAAVKDEIEAWLAEVLESGKARNIVYSGHSLGGAMAQVAAFDHARTLDEHPTAQVNDRIAAVVTFGAPMVGDPAFALKYGKMLGDSTVLLESSGDLVPRIMQRWYYRMLYPLRQRVQAGLFMRQQQDSEKFAPVAKSWGFASEPPLASADIDAAIRSLRDAAERIVKEQVEKQAKEEKAAAEKAERTRKEAEQKAAQRTTQGASDPSADGSSGTSHKSPPSNAKSNTADGTSKPAETSDDPKTWVYWVIGGIVILAATGVAWYFVRRKLFSHDIEQRYALYLSTLSYQQLRAKHGGNIALANNELDDHLRFIRGDLERSAKIKGNPFFATVQKLPLKIEVKEDPLFVQYLERPGTFL